MTKAIKTGNAVLQELKDPQLKSKGIKLFIKREDLIHPAISGNKWHKLKYNIPAALDKGYGTLLSFGGAYSNHIYALAAAGKMFDFKTIGIIRGEEHLPLNPTLAFAEECGMDIHYMNRVDYRNKHTQEILNKLLQLYGKFYLIPEGGTNSHAVEGCSEIFRNVKENFDYICTPCGTGGTIAGLIRGTGVKTKVCGFPVLKGAEFLEAEIKKLISDQPVRETAEWQLFHEYHFGGYAKYDRQLLNFIINFEENFNIPLDQVYTGKMMFGIFDLLEKNYFPDGCSIAVLHTGGLQGRLSSLPPIAPPLP